MMKPSGRQSLHVSSSPPPPPQLPASLALCIRAIQPAPGSLSGVPRTLLSATRMLQSLGWCRLHLGCWTWGTHLCPPPALHWASGGCTSGAGRGEPPSALPPPHTAPAPHAQFMPVWRREVGNSAELHPWETPMSLALWLLTRVPHSCCLLDLEASQP